MVKGWLGLIFTLTVLFTAGQAAAQAQATYRIRDVEAYAEGANASDARMKAMQQLEAQAYARLIEEQHLPPGHPATQLPPDRIAPIVMGYDIVSEQMTGRSYRIKAHVSFDGAQLQSVLQQPVQAPVVDIPASAAPAAASAPTITPAGRTLLVVPLYREQGKTLLWEEANPWRTAWSLRNSNTAKPLPFALRLPFGDLEDVATVDTAVVERRDRRALENLAGRYQATDVVVAEVTLHSTQTGKRIQITLTPYGAPGVTPFGQASFALQGTEPAASLLARGVEESLQKMMPAMTPPSAPPVTAPVAAPAGASIKVIVPLQDLSEWPRVRRSLEQAAGARRLEVVAVAPKQADLMLSYDGTPAGFMQALAKAGYRVVPSDGYWVLYPQGVY